MVGEKEKAPEKAGERVKALEKAGAGAGEMVMVRAMGMVREGVKEGAREEEMLGDFQRTQPMNKLL